MHQKAFIDPEKIYEALEFLKNSGHPGYQFFDNLETFRERCKGDVQGSKLVFVDENDVEDMVDLEAYKCNKIEHSNSTLDITVNEDDEDSADEREEENYKQNDVIRKFQFDYDKSVCITERFPEAKMTEEGQFQTISIAPGEGKIQRIFYKQMIGILWPFQ